MNKSLYLISNINFVITKKYFSVNKSSTIQQRFQNPKKPSRSPHHNVKTLLQKSALKAQLHLSNNVFFPAKIFFAILRILQFEQFCHFCAP